MCLHAAPSHFLSGIRSIRKNGVGGLVGGGGGASVCVCVYGVGVGGTGPLSLACVSFLSAHPPTDVIWEEKKTKWRFFWGAGGTLFQGQSTKGCKLARQKKKGKKGRERRGISEPSSRLSVSVIAGASQEKSLSQAQTSAHSAGS